MDELIDNLHLELFIILIYISLTLYKLRQFNDFNEDLLYKI